MHIDQVRKGDRQFDSPPVFEGLEKLGHNGQKIADILGVSPPTVSKWRNGHVPVPDEIVALLTLVLASFVEDLIEQKTDSSESTVWNFYQRARLEAAREDLAAQEKVNHTLKPTAVRAGAIRFRYWWNVQIRRQIPVGGTKFEPRVAII